MRRLVVVAFSFAMLLVMASPVSAGGVTQVSGVGELVWIGYDAEDPTCSEDRFPGEENDPDQYALALTGDLNGCLYGLVTDFRFHPSGTYQEIADEIFVGTWGELEGTFGATEFFTAKFDTETGDQIWGRCQHPVVKGSGTADFEGISGRLDFKDDVDAGTADYRGHLKLNG